MALIRKAVLSSSSGKSWEVKVVPPPKYGELEVRRAPRKEFAIFDEVHYTIIASTVGHMEEYLAYNKASRAKSEVLDELKKVGPKWHLEDVHMTPKQLEAHTKGRREKEKKAVDDCRKAIVARADAEYDRVLLDSRCFFRNSKGVIVKHGPKVVMLNNNTGEFSVMSDSLFKYNCNYTVSGDKVYFNYVDMRESCFREWDPFTNTCVDFKYEHDNYSKRVENLVCAHPRGGIIVRCSVLIRWLQSNREPVTIITLPQHTDVYYFKVVHNYLFAGRYVYDLKDNTLKYDLHKHLDMTLDSVIKTEVYPLDNNCVAFINFHSLGVHINRYTLYILDLTNNTFTSQQGRGECIITILPNNNVVYYAQYNENTKHIHITSMDNYVKEIDVPHKFDAVLWNPHLHELLPPIMDNKLIMKSKDDRIIIYDTKEEKLMPHVYDQFGIVRALIRMRGLNMHQKLYDILKALWTDTTLPNVLLQLCVTYVTNSP